MYSLDESEVFAEDFIVLCSRQELKELIDWDQAGREALIQ